MRQTEDREKKGEWKKRRRIFPKKGSLGEGRGRSPIAIKIQTEDREKKGEVKKKGEGYFKKKKEALVMEEEEAQLRLRSRQRTERRKG